MKPVQLIQKVEEEPAPKTYEQKHKGGSSERKYTEYIKPMLAKLHDEAFSDSNWIYEIKWDGYRAIAEVGTKNVRFYSRNGLSFANQYSVIYEELKKIKKDAVLDGEVVALDENGISQFQLLQQYMENPDVPLCYYVYDCLYINGESIEDKPLLERKKILKNILPPSDLIKYCDHIVKDGEAFFDVMKQRGLEGMIAKRADSTYHEGLRSSDWLKVKNVINEEAVIAGYTEPRGGRKYFGALVLGVYKNDKLEYIGHTGTGFTDKILKDVYQKLQALKTDKSPFDVKVPVNTPVTWVKPELVCNLKFSEKTTGGNRRHPVFMGLRMDKAAKDVHEEVRDDRPIGGKLTKTKSAMAKTKKTVVKDAAPAKKEDNTTTVDGRQLVFTHREKIFWPDEGYTKGDVIDYYNSVYPHIIKYLKDRPESLLRMPNGIKDKGFFQKDAGGSAPDWVETKKIWSDSVEKDIDYIICNDRPTLLYLANLGCIELNPWNSRLKAIDNPDYFVMDIDPSDNNTFEQVIETAKVIKEVLDKAGAISFPKTSGSTGIHVYVPLGAKYNYDQAKDFAHIIAQLTHDAIPGFTSLERNLAKRGKDHIYIDYLQNRRGQTLSCAYSVRPKPGATVSTPLEWKEVKKGLHPSDFTIKNILKRIEKKGDLFADVLGKGIDMKKCMKNLGHKMFV